MQQQLIEIISFADDKYLEEANPNQTFSRIKFGWKKIAVVAASIILIAVTVFSSILIITKDNGFSCTNTELAPNITVQAKSEKSIIQTGEDLIVKLYYSTPDYSDFELFDPQISTVTTKIIMYSQKYSNDWNEKRSWEVLLKDEEKDMVYDGCWRDQDNYIEDGGLFKQEITVPADWFCDDMGAIGLDVLTAVTFSDGTGTPEESDSGIRFGDGCIPYFDAGGVVFYYIKTDKDIKLFGSQYDFKKYINKK